MLDIKNTENILEKSKTYLTML